MVGEDPRATAGASVYEAINEAIDDAAAAVSGLRVIIAREDGLVIAHNLQESDLARRVAAMSASIAGTVQIATSDLGQGDFREASIEADQGRIVCLNARDGIIVSGLTSKDSNLGLALLVLDRLAKRVSDIVQRWNDVG
jgi:predicted regulator of Ras-like GTPase activity (Roadblock/LC7/MglB family)